MCFVAYNHKKVPPIFHPTPLKRKGHFSSKPNSRLFTLKEQCGHLAASSVEILNYNQKLTPLQRCHVPAFFQRRKHLRMSL